MIIPSWLTESLVPLTAGIVVSLFDKYILNNPAIEGCCNAETEEQDDDSIKTAKSDMSEALSRSSAATAATIPPAHPTHYHHVHS